jgi:peptidoglycan/LPS O-acetylase OafA/YrhL
MAWAKRAADEQGRGQTMAHAVDESKAEHWPALDGLRGTAVLAVLFEHVYQNWDPVVWLRPAHLGVELFFVLSGFLITRVLLNNRPEAVEGGSFRRVLGVFYLRRAIRIFPIYYLTLAVMIALSPWVNGLQGHHLWRLGYLTNFHMALHNTQDTYYGHLWTLAVEEQFYLIWPFVILCLPRRWLLPALLQVIALAPLWRGLASCMGLNELWIRKPFWASVDCLGAGALMALYRWQPEAFRLPSRWTMRMILIMCGLLLIAGLQGRWVEDGQYLTIPFLNREATGQSLVASLTLGTIETPFLVLLVMICISKDESWFKALMCWRPLRQLGKVSYGFYLYHAFCMSFVALGFRILNIPYLSGWGLHAFFVVVFLCSTAAAFLSWRWIEAPFNQMKKRFRYVG